MISAIFTTLVFCFSAEFKLVEYSIFSGWTKDKQYCSVGNVTLYSSECECGQPVLVDLQPDFN